ncbi:MAG: hypothetical protein WEB60_04210 [Terrimicrobiaceae bacterium]
MKVLLLLMILAVGALIFVMIQAPELGVKKLPGHPAVQSIPAKAPDPPGTPTPKPRSTYSIEMYERWAKETLANKSASKADKEKALKYLQEANKLRASQ